MLSNYELGICDSCYGQEHQNQDTTLCRKCGSCEFCCWCEDFIPREESKSDNSAGAKDAL